MKKYKGVTNMIASIGDGECFGELGLVDVNKLADKSAFGKLGKLLGAKLKE